VPAPAPQQLPRTGGAGSGHPGQPLAPLSLLGGAALVTGRFLRRRR
jgi:hypothetical protein